MMQNQFDQSQQKFDDSMDMDSGMVRGFRNSEIGIGMKDAIDVLGVSIDSQSFDQSMIDQSINSRKKKISKIKKKEDLDGSKLYRRDKSAAPDKKKKSPRKQNLCFGTTMGGFGKNDQHVEASAVASASTAVAFLWRLLRQWQLVSPWLKLINIFLFLLPYLLIGLIILVVGQCE